jgi:NADPH:quinone reductase-like Zn-dependent oxidoreductase
MKAIQIHSYGDVNVLVEENIPDPRPGPGEVLIRVQSAGVNPLDWKIRSGALAHVMPVQFPFILGWDVSGTVESVRGGVDDFKPGDRVFGLLDNKRNGAYAELVVANAGLLSLLPGGLDPVDAGALPMVSLTGVSLVELGLESKAGQKVLVTGALGGVGRSAVFALQKLGAHPIAGVRASQRKEAAALQSDVLALDDPEDLKRAAPFDGVADAIGGAVAASVLPFLRPGGVLATTVPPPPPPPEGSTAIAKPFWVKPNRAMLDRIGKAAAQGELVIPVAVRLPLSEVRQAHTLGENGVNGKILLVL